MDPLNLIPKRARVAVASGDELDVRTFAVKQHMNELSRIELRVTSANLSVALDDVIGKDATFTVTSNRESLVYTGVCMEMEQVRVDRENLATYTLVIAPRLWLTTHRKNYRIFQFLSELDIVRQLLDEWGIEHEVRCEREYKPRKFRVQYDETDFVFICRMLEDAGISFHFQAGGGGTTMILDDEPEAREVGHPALAYHDEPGVLDSPFVTRVSVLQAVRPGRMTIGDLDYRRPSTAQPRLSAARGLAQESRLEQFDYEPGVFLYGAEGGGNTPTADDRGASRTDEGVGGEKTLDRLLSRRQGEKVVRLESNVLELSPGSIFGVENHPHRALASGATQLVIGSLLEGDHDGDWRTHVEAVSTRVPYRPPQVTPKPRVPGLESATVVGPAGEEIHCDEYGRVRVHFHWDRESNRSETSSCWLPVGQPWSGASFGGINLPRVGQEVLVEFLGADPDRPVVIGRVYTELNPPPDKLPKHKMVSGIVSESSPRLVMGAADGTPGASPLNAGGTPLSSQQIGSVVTGGGERGLFNARSPNAQMHDWSGSGMKMDDSQTGQLVYMQAQKDFHVVVNDCWRTIVGNDRQCLVGTDDILEVDNVRDTQIQGNCGLRVVGNQKIFVQEKKGDDIGKDYGLQVGPPGYWLEANDTIHYQSLRKQLLVESKERIELVVGNSKIVMTPSSITILAVPKVVFQTKDGGSG